MSAEQRAGTSLPPGTQTAAHIPAVEPPPVETARLTSVPEVRVRDRKRDDARFLELDPQSLDPNRHYRWVRLDPHSSSVARRKRQGYTIEKKRQGGPITLAEADSRPDGAIVIGDVVLMSCPKSLATERDTDRRRRTQSLLASTSAETERAAAEKGISIIKDADHQRESREVPR